MRIEKTGRSGGAALGVALICAAALAPAATAHTSPPGCNTGTTIGTFDTVASGLHIVHRNGDRLDLTARVRNDVPNVCDVTDATVAIGTPNPDGTAGPTTQVASGVDVPAGTAPTNLSPTVPYDVDFDASTFSGPVQVSVSGVFHFGDDPHTPGSLGTASTPVVTSKPQATVSVTPDLTSGSVPFGVTYGYTVANTSPENPAPGQPEPELGNGAEEESILDDDICASPTFVGGNTDNEFPPHVDIGETWTFTCNHTFGSPGTFTNHVNLQGFSSRDGRPWPATSDESTVTAIGPDMTVAKSHTGDFPAGSTGQTYSLAATNSGNQATSGTVTLQDSLPSGLTATSIVGTGWTCDLATLTCTRADALPGGSAYPPVTVTVDVAADAPDQVTNVASVSGGGQTPTGNNSDSDPTTITRTPPEGDGGGGGGEGDGGGGDEPQDRDPPDGEIRKVKVKGDDVKVTFRSDEPGSTFECRLDRKPFKPCTSPKRYRNLDDGKHKVFVVATDAAGNEDSADKAKFEVD